MSGQLIHHKSSSSTIKQGPIKATIPVISLFKQQTNNLQKNDGSTLSPTNAWKTRSPEHSAGQRSPGSTCYEVKSKTLSGDGSKGSSSIMFRRTASLDTLYLKGQWPRDCFFMYNNNLKIDKATQTDDGVSEVRKSHRFVDTCAASDDKLKLIRHRLQRNAQSGRERLSLQTVGSMSCDNSVTSPTSSSQTMSIPNIVLSPTVKANPVNIPTKPLTRPSMRSSIEGLNQEIEGLVLKASSAFESSVVDRGENEKLQQTTPEGHRAPLADLLRSTRSVNTQTPAASEYLGESSRESSSPLGSREYICDAKLLRFEDESQSSSPDQEYGNLGTSPHINHFLAREPPDGCEKVNLKFIEEPVQRSVVDVCPLKPNVTFQLKPSQGSAFHPLHQISPSPSTSSDIVDNRLAHTPVDEQ